MRKITEEELIRLAIQAGFEESDSGLNLSGESDLDESIYAEECPVGECLKRFTELLGVEVE